MLYGTIRLRDEIPNQEILKRYDGKTKPSEVVVKRIEDIMDEYKYCLIKPDFTPSPIRREDVRELLLQEHRPIDKQALVKERLERIYKLALVYGTGRKAQRIISEKTGIPEGTVRAYMYKTVKRMVEETKQRITDT